MPRKPARPPRQPSAERPRVAVVVSRYNAPVTDALLAGARRAWAAARHTPANLTIVDAAGAFELVPLAAAAATSGRYDGVLALGCIIRGETDHDQYLAHAVTSGLADIALHTALPVGLGVLTVNDAEQARERAGGRLGNKGGEAMQAVLASIAGVEALFEGRSWRLRTPRPAKVGTRKKGRT